MNKLFTLIALSSLLLSAVLMSSCISFNSTTTKETKSTSTASTEAEPLSASDVGPLPVPGKFPLANRYFKITGTEKGLEAIVIQDNTADIQDLAAFASCLYKEHIGYALKHDEKLSAADLELLQFAIDTQIAALKHFCDVELAAMKLPPSPTELIMDGADESTLSRMHNLTFDMQLQEVINTACDNFGTNNNAFYRKLHAWGESFLPIGQELIKRDLQHIEDGQREIIDRFQWRKIWIYCDPTFIAYFCTKYYNCDKDLMEEQALRPYKKFKVTAEETSCEWRSIHDAMGVYIQDLDTMRHDIFRYIVRTKSDQGRRDLEKFIMAYDKEMRKAIRQCVYINCDFPFSVFCKKAYIDIQNCKGFFNDDEEEMENVIHTFARLSSGADMLEGLRSPYTAMIYVQLLELAKSELGDRWEAVKTACKLYELDDISDSFVGKNSLKRLN